MPTNENDLDSSDDEYEYETESDSDDDVKTKMETKAESKSKTESKPKTVAKPKNDSDVIKAILDAYLSTRITEKMRGWTDFELGGKFIPSSLDVANKLRAIIKLVKLLPDCNINEKQQAWLTLLTECKREELVQHQIKEDTRDSYWGLGKYVVGEEARFEQALCAIRSFVVKQMNKTSYGESFLKTETDNLSKQQSTAQQKYETAKATPHANSADVEKDRIAYEKCKLKYNAIVEASAASDFHHTFFTEFMIRDKRLDKNGSPLTEDKFGQFKKNSLSGDREIKFLDKLMAMENVLTNPKATANKSFFGGLMSFLAPRASTAQAEGSAPKPKC